MLFAYERSHGQETHIGQVSFQLADTKKTTPGVPFDDEYFSQITFLFVKPDFQGHGVGRDLVMKALEIIKGHESSRPVRVQSAEKAVGFFEKLGFVQKGEPIESTCGIRLFRFMYNMELKLS